MAPAESSVALNVMVAYSPRAGLVDGIAVRLPSESTVHDAILASGILQRHPGIDLTVQRVGVWGRLKPLEAILRDQDRVEIYRPLQVDPKQARRERYRKQRAGR
jgi:hypothetical protein